MRLLLVGFGTVGQGLGELLLEKQSVLQKQYNLDIKVVGIADMLKGSIYNSDGIDLAKAIETAKAGNKLSELSDKYDGDALSMIKNADADMMVEATYTDIKTGEPATTHIRTALEKGMHVTTMNKGPLALFYPELAKLAKDKGVKFLFEGTVMSGTPIINLIRETLAASGISQIQGILNGTTNYMLSKMEEGMGYDEVLKKAQELGYAEAVPDADVLGWDALAKVTILANVVFGANLKPSDSPCKGITEISADDIKTAAENGKRYKLIGKVWKDGDTVKGSVAPVEVDLSHPLASIADATNALTITTDALGDVTIIGPGAGRVETGYSALIDIIHVGGLK